jgi:acyl-CoA reductase-like NAD-dependent aldehyde dehydrogenase
MGSEPRMNFLAGEWCPPRRGASSSGGRGAAPIAWPQSDGADVAQAWRAARAASPAWLCRSADERARYLEALARELEGDADLAQRLGERFALEPRELAPHFTGLVRGLGALCARPAPVGGGEVAWWAPDWRELVRAPFLDLARECLAGRVLVLVSDARVPELAHHFARAARAADLPPGVLGVLHGATRELLQLGIAAANGDSSCTLVASGSVARMVELRRLESTAGIQSRLRALRCGVHEVASGDALEDVAAEVVERAFGRATTLGGQLPGALGRVFCPARLFSRFTELVLERLESSDAARAPVPLVDDGAVAQARAAWELGLDEGATCIAGGDASEASRVLPPTVFTNVETYMATAKRQDPLPVLCLLRGS